MKHPRGVPVAVMTGRAPCPTPIPAAEKGMGLIIRGLKIGHENLRRSLARAWNPSGIEVR